MTIVCMSSSFIRLRDLGPWQPVGPQAVKQEKTKVLKVNVKSIKRLELRRIWAHRGNILKLMSMTSAGEVQFIHQNCTTEGMMQIEIPIESL